MNNLISVLLVFYFCFSSVSFANEIENSPPAEKALKRRVASVLVSETFINEQITKYASESKIFRDLKIQMDAKKDHLYLRGRLLLPVDKMHFADINRQQSDFKFQVTIKPRATKDGSLRLEFPIAETYFYQTSSKNPNRDKVVIPVQLLSLTVASMRGYIAALSGDFKSFDKKMANTRKDLIEIKKQIANAETPDQKEDFELEKKSIELQLKSNEIERVQLERTAKKLSNILSFLGEEANLNNEIEANENSIILKVNLGRILPYLKDITLAGIRISHDATDEENFLVVGADSALEVLPPRAERSKRKQRERVEIPPSLLIRINQAVFNSKVVVAAKNEKLGSTVSDLDVALKEDGIHITGKVKKFFITFPFDTTVDFVTTGPDVFEVRLRELKVKSMDLKFLTKYVLEAVKERMDKALAGMLTFEYLGHQNDSQVLKVTVDPKSLVPAFPNLHLVSVDVGNREFMLKMGHIKNTEKQ